MKVKVDKHGFLVPDSAPKPIPPVRVGYGALDNDRLAVVTRCAIDAADNEVGMPLLLQCDRGILEPSIRQALVPGAGGRQVREQMTGFVQAQRDCCALQFKLRGQSCPAGEP